MATEVVDCNLLAVKEAEVAVEEKAVERSGTEAVAAAVGETVAAVGGLEVAGCNPQAGSAGEEVEDAITALPSFWLASSPPRSSLLIFKITMRLL